MAAETTAGKLVLFMFPGACSRVTMSALEEVGLAYEERMVNLQSFQQKGADYLALNPKGKVPALRVGERIMTENAAILFFLDREHPSAKLLPRHDGTLGDQQSLIDLIWCTGTLHPIVRQIRAPARYTKGDTSGVKSDGMDKFAHEMSAVADRLSEGRWWYGAAWSILDVYFYWLYSTAEKGGFPVKDYPALVEHARRVRARSSFQRALAREEIMVARYRSELSAEFQL